MASGPSIESFKHLRTLFHVGAVGGLSDGQLLELFVQRRDADAFAALVDRHGPMVLRVCQGRLGQFHDAEDAFQATFLVLARRAPSIRKSEAVAGWLLGVAGRVAAKAWSAARRRSVSERPLRHGDDLAVNTPPPEPWTELYDELDRLPEKYRLPLVLCHLEGLTYDQAASRLGCPVRTVQTRLARGRERLRGRLARRGLDPPAVLVAAPLPADAVLVPAALKEATVNLARTFGGTNGPVAVILATKVCRAMVLAKIGILCKAAALCAVVGAGAWVAWLRIDARRSNPPAGATARSDDAPAPEPSSASEAGTPDEEYYITGFVRDEKTSAPVAGATVRAHVGIKDLNVESRDMLTDADGRFSIAVPEGNARVFLNPPPGYWLPEPAKHFDFLAVSRDHSVQRKDFPVRRGTLWRFRLTRGPDHAPVQSGSIMQTAWDRVETDANGIADVTLPSEAGEASLLLWGSTRLVNLPKQQVKIRWDAGFRPEAVKSITRHDQPDQSPSSRLADNEGRLAVITGAVEPTTTADRLMISASITDVDSPAGRGPASTGTLTGTVIDHAGRPVAEAHVTIFYQFRDWGSMSDRKEHWVRTDRQGKYTIPSVPRKSYEGDLTRLSVVVYKAGFVGADSPVMGFWPGDKGIQVMASLRLEPGIPLKGNVVDPDRRPVAGAEIRVMGCWATGAQTYRSGADGRFLIPHVKKGVVPISINCGPLSANGKYVVDRSDELTIQIRPRSDLKAIAAARSKPVLPLKTGQPAALWNVTGWTDGEARTLADFRGKVVALEFWGIWCSPCVNSLSFVDSERQRFSDRGVVFLSIHTPGDSLENIRKLYALKKVSLVSAVDEGHEDDIGGGTTASAYGIRGHPTFVLIDRAGKIAFRSDDSAASAGSNLAGAIEKLLAKP
jgi:RNA polymerase sigma factor (sigma-70 family)